MGLSLAFVLSGSGVESENLMPTRCDAEEAVAPASEATPAEALAGHRGSKSGFNLFPHGRLQF